MTKAELIGHDDKESMGYFYFYTPPMKGDILFIKGVMYEIILRSFGFKEAKDETMEAQIKEKYTGAFSVFIQKIKEK